MIITDKEAKKFEDVKMGEVFRDKCGNICLKITSSIVTEKFEISEVPMNAFCFTGNGLVYFYNDDLVNVLRAELIVEYKY